MSKTLGMTPPTGLKISRNKKTFTFEWSCSTKYTSGLYVNIRVIYRNGGIREVKRWYPSNSLRKTSKSKFSNNEDILSFNKYESNRPSKIRLDVSRQDKRYNGWEGTHKDFELYAPNKPTITYAAGVDNSGTFTWTRTSSDTDHKPVYGIEWKFIQKKDYSGSNADAFNEWWSNTSYDTGENTSSSSGSIKKEVTSLGSSSYAHIFAVRTRGYYGDSNWVYLKHVYATPNKPIVTGSNLKKSGSQYALAMNIKYEKDALRPVDYIYSQYLIASPEEEMTCPSNGSWTNAYQTTYAQYTNVSKVIDIEIPENQCVFSRARVLHDSNMENFSEPVLVYKGELTKPTLGDTIELDNTNGTLTLTGTNNSKDVPDSCIQVQYRIGNGTYSDLGTISQEEADEKAFTKEIFKTTKAGTYQVRIRTVVFTKNKSGANEIAWNSAWVYSVNKTYASAPANLTVTALEDGTTAELTWDWSWTDATGARIAWADHEDAWYSTDAPSTSDLEDVITKFRVSNLDEKTYYFRVRLIDQSGDKDVYGPWSDTVSLDVASTPTVPTLALNQSYVNVDGELVATVGYSGDVDSILIQEYISSGEWIDVVSAKSNQVTISIYDLNALYIKRGDSDYIWKEGTTHTLRATAIKGANETVSEAVAIDCIAKPTIAVSQTGLEVKTIIDDDEDPTITHEALTLSALPLKFEIKGAGGGGAAKAIIERIEDYILTRPTESKEERSAGEIIYSNAAVALSDSQSIDFEIALESLAGNLDDGCHYNAIITVIDTYGQTATQTVPFEVHWTHQPEIPTVAVETLKDDLATKITVTKPTSYEDGDCFDLYRLSADKPELVLSDCEYDTAYVDPYPAFGEFGGHRIVNKTANGDYITTDNEFAWMDTDKDAGDYVDNKEIIVDFNGQRVNLPYGISLNNSWSKDFTRTTYLGGSVAGDWNPAVTRDLSASTTVLAVIDPDTIKAMRALASYAGICHIRTPEGSSFACDIQVSESREGSTQKVVSFSLTIKQVDTEGFDGMTYEEWKKESEGE